MKYYRFGGAVGVSTGIGNDGTVFVGFEHLDKTHKVGENLNPDEATPETFLIFNNLESIDIVIDKLEQAREILKQGILNYENSEFDYGHNINNRNNGTDY